MKFNVNKCETLVTSRKKDRSPNRIMLKGGPLKEVENVKYLEGVLEINGRNDKEIGQRCRQAEAILRSARSIVWNKDVPQRSKAVIYKSYYIPILTYTSETWVMQRKGVSEMKFLRSRIGVI